VRLFAVGDPDQSVYGFTGARPDLLRELAERSDVARVDLRLNYRSGRKIVAACEHALGEHRGYTAFRAEDGHVGFTFCSGGLSEQVAQVVERLIPAFLDAGDSHGDIAVLYPTQQEGDALAGCGKTVRAGAPCPLRLGFVSVRCRCARLGSPASPARSA